MTKSTVEVLRAALRADPTITSEQRDAILRGAMDGDRGMTFRPIERVVPFNEAARLAGVTVKRIYQYVAAGNLASVKFPGSCRASGVAEASLRAFLSPKSEAAAVAAQ
jgi:hypothetical protein